MTSLSRIVAALAVSLGLFACKDDPIDTGRYAEVLPSTVCDAVIACGCDYPNGAMLDHCVSQLGVNASTLAEINSVEGLSFDGGCAQREIDAIGSLGCGVPTPVDDARCEKPCKVWHGPMGRGGTCTSINGYDNCKQGLACSDGVCVDPCAEPDLPRINEPCAVEFGCDEGAFCDGVTSPLYPICVALPLAGQPCIENVLLCAEDLFCDTTDADAPLCAALAGIGEECPDGVCAQGAFCDLTETPAVCTAPPTLGQECMVGFCAAPYLCEDGTCIEPRPTVCGYYGGIPDGIDPTAGPGTGMTDDTGNETGDTGVDTGLDTGVDTGLDTGLDTGPIAGDCCVAGDVPGCSDPEITACVCTEDPVCCQDIWDEICAGAVVEFGCGVC